jgi:hypothetical protein
MYASIRVKHPLVAFTIVPELPTSGNEVAKALMMLLQVR